MLATLRQQLLEVACEPYRPVGFFHYHWARGKLGGDPIFTALLEQEILRQQTRVLDLGCGRGLLAAWFLAAERLTKASQWTVDFHVTAHMTFHGVDLDASGCKAGNLALRPFFDNRVSLEGGDMCRTDLSGYDAITILDVLHYIPYTQQDQLLDRIREALPPGGLLVTRIGNAQGGWRFRMSQWVDLVMANAQGHRIRTMYCRPLAEWIHALETRGFAVNAQPMSEGTPFANVLLVARMP